jgi:hypothetical protein
MSFSAPVFHVDNSSRFLGTVAVDLFPNEVVHHLGDKLPAGSHLMDNQALLVNSSGTVVDHPTSCSALRFSLQI